ncbi:hypothetical protein [Butyrivibrio sp.]|uniref:hypothetical protein n=1 Tax=Butyrivibrio sp. TaxID=28121 RepID=UPI0025BB79C3|nr:hypothetical protein [Butyrivibrio sp.]MBQ9303459.1 hypothetical protein [Butyrivibrio sp.]
MKILDQIVPIQVYSNVLKAMINLQAYQTDEPGNYVIAHNSLKSYMLENMARALTAKQLPIKVAYAPIETALSHSIVSCTISMGNYEVTETGEACVATLETPIAKNYPYLEAEMRAFDRAAISFLQLNINGKRVYTDEELSASVRE